MRKDIVSVTIDTETMRVLADLAGREAQGNRSLAFRRIVREAAEKRGLWPMTEQREVKLERQAA